MGSHSSGPSPPQWIIDKGAWIELPILTKIWQWLWSLQQKSQQRRNLLRSKGGKKMAETTMAITSQKEGSPTHNNSFSNSNNRWKASKILSCPTSRTRVKLLKPSNLACLRMMVWVMMNLKFEWSDESHRWWMSRLCLARFSFSSTTYTLHPRSTFMLGHFWHAILMATCHPNGHMPSSCFFIFWYWKFILIFKNSIFK